MQKLVLKLASISLLVAVLFFSSCGEDDPITPNNALGPEASLDPVAGSINSDASLEIGEPFTVTLSLSSGDSPLQFVRIEVERLDTLSLLSTDLFTLNGGAITSNNPFTVPESDKEGMTSYTIDIRPSPTQAGGDINLYTFIVQDEAGEMDEVDIQITTLSPPVTTPLDTTIVGALLNQAGEDGGLDLDTGMSTGTVGSGAANSEIRDLGIDCTINQEVAENWRGLFGTFNGADMVQVNTASIENFSFSAVDNKEVIRDAYDTGITLRQNVVSQSPQCVETPVTDVVPDNVAVGDVFAVFANNRYYLIRVDEINFVHGPPEEDNNKDNFVFSIKY